jgi:septal ring factor EnvC (AmiA/AmiB activator)
LPIPTNGLIDLGDTADSEQTNIQEKIEQLEKQIAEEESQNHELSKQIDKQKQVKIPIDEKSNLI